MSEAPLERGQGSSPTTNVEPPSPTSRAERARRNVLSRRALIASCAANLFNERGYHTTSMGDIASASDTGKATLYHYFASKSQILVFIHDQLMDILVSGHRERIDRGLPPADLLHGAMLDMIRLNDTHPGHVRVFFEHYRELPEEERALVDPKREEVYEHVRQILRDGMADQTFRAVDDRVAAMAVFAMCHGVAHSFGPRSTLDHTELADCFWDYLAGGLLSKDS